MWTTDPARPPKSPEGQALSVVTERAEAQSRTDLLPVPALPLTGFRAWKGSQAPSVPLGGRGDPHSSVPEPKAWFSVPLPPPSESPEHTEIQMGMKVDKGGLRTKRQPAPRGGGPRAAQANFLLIRPLLPREPMCPPGAHRANSTHRRGSAVHLATEVQTGAGRHLQLVAGTPPHPAPARSPCLRRNSSRAGTSDTTA